MIPSARVGADGYRLPPGIDRAAVTVDDPMLAVWNEDMPERPKLCFFDDDRRARCGGGEATGLRPWSCGSAARTGPCLRAWCDSMATPTSYSMAELAEDTLRDGGARRPAAVPARPRQAPLRRRTGASSSLIRPLRAGARRCDRRGRPATSGSTIAACRRRRRVPASASGDGESSPALHAAGAHVPGCTEVIVRATDFTLKTPRRANLRHTGPGAEG